MAGRVLTDLDLQVVREFAENDMNVSATARVLHMGRTTALCHLEKVTEITGLNPLVFYDLVELLDTMPLPNLPKEN